MVEEIAIEQAKAAIQQARRAGDVQAERAAVAALRRLRAEQAQAALGGGDGVPLVWLDGRDA